MNILHCQTNPDQSLSAIDSALHLVPIGIFDYFRRGAPTPFILHDTYFECYELLTEKTHPTSMVAIQLCDAFITKILKADESVELYNITSALSADVFNASGIDGVLYPSTKFDGFPNVVLRTSSVDRKLRYEKAISVKVEESYGYGIFKTTLLNEGVAKDGKIHWKNP